MAQITGGKVSYGRTVKTGDYENKRIDVEMTFSVAEGEDYGHIFDLVSRQVARRVEEMARGKEWAVAEPLKPELPSGAAPAETVLPAGKSVTAPEQPTRQTEAPIETKPKRGPGRPKKETLKPKDEPEVTEAKVAEEKKLEEITEGMENDPEDDITDKELQEKISHRVKAVGPDRIKKLVWEISGVQGSFANQLPQSKRRAFLKKLEALE